MSEEWAGRLPGENQVIIEARMQGGWRPIGSVSDVEPPGSITSHEPERQVYMFGWYEGVAGVWRSQFGFDEENPAVRAITTTGFDRLADLAKGPHELTTRSASGREMNLRFRVAPASSVKLG